MGVFSGDIVVPDFPTMVQFAFYSEYVPDKGDQENIEFDLWIMQDDKEVAKAQMQVSVVDGMVAALILPRGLLHFEDERRFRLLYSIGGGEKIELMSKRVFKGVLS
jgi:hypothetical protein